MQISDSISKRHQKKTFLIFISVKVINFSLTGVLTKSLECQNSFPSHPDLVPMLVLKPNDEINI